MTGLRIWLLIAIVLGGGALLACKSSNKSTTPTATKSSSATQASDATKVSGTTPSATGGDASAALAALESKAATKEVKAAYSYTSTAAGTTTNGSFTLYSKPPDWRADFTSTDVTATIISTGGTSYLCTAQGGTGTCLPSPTTASALPFLTLFTDPASLSAVIGSDVSHSTKTVAGQDADCYSGTAAGSQGEVCFSSDGVLLSLTSNSGGTEFTLAATSVAGTVSASDLTLPYPVQ
jgi:outer membrane lipoprotein-sorting protein